MNDPRVALRAASILLIILVGASVAATPTTALPSVLTASDHFSLSIRTNPPYAAYSGGDAITIMGTLSPPPSVKSNVTITIKNPGGTVVATSLAPVSPGPSGGGYSHTFSAGGSCLWNSGTYVVAGLWSNPVGAAIAEANNTFTYTASAAPCASTSTSMTTTTPEFGIQALLLVMLVVMVATAFIAKRLAPSAQADSVRTAARWLRLAEARGNA